jgi:hypothetical protein
MNSSFRARARAHDRARPRHVSLAITIMSPSRSISPNV